MQILRQPIFVLHLVAFFTSFLFSTDSSRAQEPENKSLTITFDFKDRKIPIRFRSCPPGKLIAGQPKPDEPGDEPATPSPDSPLATIGGPVSIDEFYLTETEITAAEFAAVVGSAEFEKFRDAAKRKLEGSTAQGELAKLDPQGSYPAFMISSHDAVKFCEALESAQHEQMSETASIERKRFRLPSHQEWQYACRAQTDPQLIQKYPHFHNWIESEALPSTDLAKCHEEWKELGHKVDDFVGTQFQIIEIVNNRYETQPTKTLEILSAFLRESLGTSRDYSKQLPGQITAVGGTKANRWGFVDMHENVHEWTITIADKADLQDFWTKIRSAQSDQELKSRKVFFLAGGAFNAFMANDKSAEWPSFTIWGGKPMDSQSKTPQPFSMEDESASDMAFEYMPGFRILMERVLSDTWLLALRRTTIPTTGNVAQAAAELDKYRLTVREIVPMSQQAQLLAAIDFYNGLNSYAAGNTAEAARILESAKGKLFAEKKKKANLAALAALANSNSSTPDEKNTAPIESDDQAFQRLLQDVVVADASAQQK